jgi:hypothetical protein
VKLKVTHTLCGREVFVRQIVESAGHCPWDGKPFEKDYTAILAEALEQAEVAGGILENALEKISGMNPDMTIDPAAIMDPIAANLDRLNRPRMTGKR